MCYNYHGDSMSLKYRILVSALFRNLNSEIDSSNLRFYRNVVSNEIFVLSLDTKWEENENVLNKSVMGVIEPISNSKIFIFPRIKPFYYNQFGYYGKYDNRSMLEEYLAEDTFLFTDENGGEDNNYNFLYKGDYYQEIPEVFLNIKKCENQNIKLRDIYKMYKALNEENIFESSNLKGL